MSVEQAKTVAQTAAEKLAEEYQLQSTWDGDKLTFACSGVKGHMDVTPNEIKLAVSLGLLLKPFKSRLEHRIGQRLDELLLVANTKAKALGKKARATVRPDANPRACRVVDCRIVVLADRMPGTAELLGIGGPIGLEVDDVERAAP